MFKRVTHKPDRTEYYLMDSVYIDWVIRRTLITLKSIK